MHIRTWMIWIASMVAVTLSTRNPLYLVLILLVTQVVRAGVAGTKAAQGDAASAPNWWWRFGITVIPLSALFNAASVHFGDTVFFTIPGSLPLISGPVTLEALVYGAVNGLLLTVVVSVFGVFNLAIPAYQLVRSTPRAFQSMGVTVGIALAFVPQTMRRFKEVREAQAVRGHRIRHVRDWLPLWLPLLIGGLEQSTQLSEAMVARGFGSTQDRMSSLRTRLLFVCGLALVLAGWLLRLVMPSLSGLGIPLMVIGGVLVIAGLWWSGRAVPHTVFRPQPFTPYDAAACVVSLAIAVLWLLPGPLALQASILYYPYPHLIPPQFDPAAGILILGGLVPLAGLRRSAIAQQE